MEGAFHLCVRGVRRIRRERLIRERESVTIAFEESIGVIDHLTG